MENIRAQVACSLMWLALSAGCDRPVSQEQASRQVLAEDPSFQETLAKKTELDTQINGLQRELFAKKSDIDLKVKELQREYQDAKRSTGQQIKVLVVRLQPQREQLQLELTLAQNQRKSARADINGLRRSLGQVRASLKRSGAVDQAELSRKLDELGGQLAQRQTETSELDRRLRLLRMKLQLLRQ